MFYTKAFLLVAWLLDGKYLCYPIVKDNK